MENKTTIDLGSYKVPVKIGLWALAVTLTIGAISQLINFVIGIKGLI